ncbi:MAG: histidinol-phosphate transaminase [Bacillota bacterium]|nr:histidinol-phosphate transaminase [Bacillota bacterium]
METDKLTHGGDWAGFETEYGKEPLDFSMNVNPLGISMHTRLAISKAGGKAYRYPDPLCRQLRAKLSLHECVPSSWIYCGNGAADIIYRLAAVMEPARLLVTSPTFSEYETAFAANGWEVSHYRLREDNGFRLDKGFIDAIDERVSAVFLCEPNNPTGVTTERELLIEILQFCRDRGIMLIIDECFNGFLEEPAEHSMINFLPEYDKLVILKAFTKLYGMAGIRLGYCLCSNCDLTGGLYRYGAPWNVSSLAQEAGIAALEDRNHVRGGRRIVREQKPWLLDSLKALGITRIYGEANYLFFRSRPDLAETLRTKGILIRDCSNYPGLEPGWFRIAVKTEKDNRKLVEAMKEVLQTGD